MSSATVTACPSRSESPPQPARQPGPGATDAGHPTDPLAPWSQAPPTAKLHADKGYDFEHLRRWLRRRQIVPRIARRGKETSSRLGRHRWVIERTLSWLTGCRRLHRRYERKAEHFLAFASALICYRRHAA